MITSSAFYFAMLFCLAFSDTYQSCTFLFTMKTFFRLGTIYFFLNIIQHPLIIQKYSMTPQSTKQMRIFMLTKRSIKSSTFFNTFYILIIFLTKFTSYMPICIIKFLIVWYIVAHLIFLFDHRAILVKMNFSSLYCLLRNYLFFLHAFFLNQ